MSSVGHLVRRFRGSLSSVPPPAADDTWARSFLQPAEVDQWVVMSAADRRHAVEVARRFVLRRPDASRAEVAGALLHDVGKVVSGLGTFSRVVATVVGPRTKRFRLYHDHERLGAELLEREGSDPVTVALVRGEGPALADLLLADDI